MGNGYNKKRVEKRAGAERKCETMTTFTSEEINLMCLYSSGTRLELIDNLTDMRGYLQVDETELRELTDRVLEKLRRMNDQEFSALDLYPDFMD